MNQRLKISIEEYHAHPAVGSTDQKNMLVSPAHYLTARRLGSKPTPAKIFGQTTHDSLLEPELFRSKYVAGPEGLDRRTKEGKEKWESFLIANPGKTIIDAKDFLAIDGMVRSVHEHPAARKLLSSGRAEESFFWTDEASGVACKCRPDFLRDGGLLVDIKTCESASADDFSKQILNYRYYGQAAHYLDGVSAVTGQRYDKFIIVAVEKEPPYAVAVYLIDDASIEMGRSENARVLKLFAECQKNNFWPAYSDEIQSISVPKWALERAA